MCSLSVQDLLSLMWYIGLGLVCVFGWFLVLVYIIFHFMIILALHRSLYLYCVEPLVLVLTRSKAHERESTYSFFFILSVLNGFITKVEFYDHPICSGSIYALVLIHHLV